MEPNNFEKDFRDKLNQRTIEPSNKAWDRLDAMLSIAEEKKPKKNRKWMYIAASIVGFLLVGTFFFSQKEKTFQGSKDSFVIEQVEKKDSVIKPTLDIINSAQSEVAIFDETAIQSSNKVEKNLPKHQDQKSNKTIKNESNQITESSIIIKNNQETEPINQTLVVENSKNENVDQLLDSAEKTVIVHSAKPKSKIKINADDLLNQVDGELELSFREKVITKVNKNYRTVKVALANRNQQE